MPDETKHQSALDLIQENRLQEALNLLDLAIQERETSELWNDWATVQITCGRMAEARKGYERAAGLNPGNARAQFNLGLVLVQQGELKRGLDLLRSSCVRLGKPEQDAVSSLIGQYMKVFPQPKASGKRLLLIHDILPHFDRSGSDMRLMQVIRRLRAGGHEVTYIGRHPAGQQQYEPPLKELGIRVFTGDGERLRAMGMDIEPLWKLDEVLRDGHFDAAILFHWFWSGISVAEQYLDDIRRLSPRTRIVIMTDDRHGIREWRAAQSSGLISDCERALDFLDREYECYRAADLVLAISEEDRQGLLEIAPELEIELLPMTAEVAPDALQSDPRRDFVFLANFDNLANRDAIAWLCHEIWPRIRKRLPDAGLYLAGNNIPSELASQEGVQTLGFIANVEEALRKFRVFLSPVRFGTGIQTKNLIAMSQGLPVVSTTVGAGGMALTDGENVLLADSAGAFINKAVALYENSVLRQQIAANAISHLTTEFSLQKLDQQIEKIMERIHGLESQAFDPDHRFSFNLPEEFHPNVVTGQPAESRFQLRALAYVELAERLLEMNKPAESRRQLRHLFSYVRGPAPRTLFFARAFSLLEHCYRELGENEEAVRCGQEAKLCLPELNPVMTQEAAKARAKWKRSSGPQISVIIPTFNRRSKLERCLKALASQSLPVRDFEVIVVDDGSTDDTGDFVRKLETQFPAHYVRQSNQGAGAARKAGVDRAKGEYVLLMNDDTIAHPELLDEHLAAQHKNQATQPAVQGSFEYEPAARNRALTWFLNTSPFMFPQSRMTAGSFYGAMEFVTCNLSIARAVLSKAGSFDAAFPLGEDLDLGIRVDLAGHRVFYHPQARSWHDHLDVTVDDVLRRAGAYGLVYVQLLGKYEHLEVSTPFGKLYGSMDIANLEEIRALILSKRTEVEENVKALRQYDSIDFTRFFDVPAQGGGSLAGTIMELFRQAVPYVHWFYLLNSFCKVWTPPLPQPASFSKAGLQA